MSVRYRATIAGVVEGGRGIGAELMTDPVVLGGIQTAVGLEIVPGTLNVRIPDPLNRKLLSSYLPGGEIDPAWEADTG